MKIHNISKNREVSHKTSFFMPPVVEGSDGTTVDTLPRLRMRVIYTPLKPGSVPNSNGIHDYYSYLLASEHDVKGNAFLSIRPGWTVWDVKRILQEGSGEDTPDLCLNDGTPLTDSDGLSPGTVLYTRNGVERRPEERKADHLVLVVNKARSSSPPLDCDKFWSQVWDIDEGVLSRNFNYHALDNLQTWTLIQRHLHTTYPNLTKWWEKKMQTWQEAGCLGPNPNFDWHKHFQLRDSTDAVVGAGPPDRLYAGRLEAFERVVVLKVRLDEEREWCPPQPIEQSLSAPNRPSKKQKHEEKQDEEETTFVVAAVLLCRARTSESEWQEERDAVEACNHDVASEFLKWASDLVSVCGGYEGWAQDPILQQEGNKNVLPWLRAREFGKVNDLFC